ncbi:MAG: acetylxylan esterase [Gemmatimonadetes bacterium]|jgi:hypothetical protein|nr:acetylxylan esterase [Gemmatimonadota bacterium]MBT7864605.1 acetylxylan esterase [Gemmatimonadota bacterium]
MTQESPTFSRPALADAVFDPEPINPLPVSDSVEVWSDQRHQILAAWQNVIGQPDFARGDVDASADHVGSFEQQDYTADIYRQPTTPNSRQTILVMTPKRPLGATCPGMVVPFYDPDRMVGLDLATQTSLPDRVTVTEFGRHVAGMGFIVVCPEVYPFNTVEEPTDSSGMNWWQAAADQLQIDHPHWTGVGRLAWDASRALDLLLQQPGIDATRCGIIGHSLGGKIAFYAAALDTRFSLCISSDFGIGFSFTNWDDDWYLGDRIHAPGFARAHHELLALIAPRPFFLVGGEADRPASWHYIQEAQRVYSLYGRQDAAGFFHHGAGHRPTPEAMQIAYAWLADQFGITLETGSLQL